MRVPSSSFSESVVSQLQRLTARQAQLQNQAATGQRITNPGDDPEAMNRVLNVNAEKEQLQQFSRNNGRALEISQTSYEAATGLKKLSDRASEITVLGGSIASPEAFNAYATEVNQLIEQAVQTGNSKFSGNYIMGGVRTDTPPFNAVRDTNGKITSVTYDGAATAAQIRISESATVTPATDGTANQQFADFMNHLVSLRDALQSGSATSVQAVRPNLQTSEDNLLNTISDIGAKQTRLEADAAQNEARFTELQKRGSQDTDIDLAQTIVKLTQTQTAYQAALQSGAQLLHTSLLDYLR